MSRSSVRITSRLYAGYLLTGSVKCRLKIIMPLAHNFRFALRALGPLPSKVQGLNHRGHRAPVKFGDNMKMRIALAIYCFDLDVVRRSPTRTPTTMPPAHD